MAHAKRFSAPLPSIQIMFLANDKSFTFLSAKQGIRYTCI